MSSAPALAFLLKTYPKDYHYAVRLIRSYFEHNVDGIPMFVVGPSGCEITIKEEIGNYTENQGVVSFLDENDFPGTVDSWYGLSVGYINQEIIKLSFWEKGLCENYYCLDSDAIFIRDFYKKDFMWNEHIPYSIVYDDSELVSDPLYYERFWKARENALKKIKDELEIDWDVWTCHGFQIFNAKILQSFRTEYMEKKGYSYADLLRISPYEFSWYNYYLQKSRAIPIVPKGQLFKTFHLPENYVFYCLEGKRVEDLARGYIGIIVNSNYTDGRDEEYGKIDKYHIRFPQRYRWYVIREILRSFLGDLSRNIKGRNVC